MNRIFSTSGAKPHKPWFTTQPIGKCFKEGNLSGNYASQSLRAYGASTMFRKGIPEKLVQERTGH